MKTNLLFAATLLLSAGMYAQTVKSSSAESATATAAKTTELNAVSRSTTTASSDAGIIITRKANQGRQQAKQELKSAQKPANTREKETVSAVKEKNDASVSINSQEQANAGLKDNKASQDASLQGNVVVSAKPVKSNVKAVAQHSSTEVKAGGKTAVKTTAAVTSTGKAIVSKTVQPKPAAIRMQTRVQANGGIKIK